MRALNKSGKQYNTPKLIKGLHDELQKDKNITSLNLSRNNISSMGAMNALIQLLLNNSQITSLNLSRNNISSMGAMLCLQSALSVSVSDSKVTSLNLSYNNITSKEEIDYLGMALLDSQITSLNLSGNNITSKEAMDHLSMALLGTKVTSLNLSGNNITSKEAMDALRGLLRQNQQITSLDLSDTGLNWHELLSLVSEFPQLHHVGIDGERPEIAEQLQFNRVLKAKALVRTLWQDPDFCTHWERHPDLVCRILDQKGLTVGLDRTEIDNLIAEATAPAFNFQRGNPNAISFAPAAGGIPRISITFESGDGLSEFTKENDHTFRELGARGATVEHSGTGVIITAPNKKVGTLIEERFEAIINELSPLSNELENSRTKSNRSTSQVAGAARSANENEPDAAADHVPGQQPVGPHTQRIKASGLNAIGLVTPPVMDWPVLDETQDAVAAAEEVAAAPAAEAGQGSTRFAEIIAASRNAQAAAANRH
jgi:hypothetical protein